MRQPRVIAVSVFALLCLVGLGFWLVVENYERDRLLAETEHAAELSTQNLQAWTDHRFALLKHLRNHADTVEEFNEHAAEIMTAFPGFLAINWIDSEYRIQSVLPPEPNTAALGKLVIDHPDPKVRTALFGTEKTGQPQGTLVDNLFQGGPGYACYTPVLNRQEQVQGYINGVFRLEQFQHIAQMGTRSKGNFRATLRAADDDQPAEAQTRDSGVIVPFEIPGAILAVHIQPSKQYLAHFGFMADELAFFLFVIIAALMSWQMCVWLERGEDLRETRRLSEGLAESIPQAAHIYNCDNHRFEYFNGHLDALIGQKHANAVRESGEAFIALLHDDDRPQLDAILLDAQRMHDGKVLEMEYRLRHSDGRWRWLRSRLCVMKYLADGPTTLVGTTEDITERKRMLEELADRVEYQRLFTELSARFINAPIDSMNDELRRAMERLGRMVGVERCFISEFEERTTIVKRTIRWCEPDVQRHIKPVVRRNVGKLAWAKQQYDEHGYIAVDSVEDLPPEASAERALYQEEGVQSAIHIPILTQGQLCGYFGLDCITHTKPWSKTLIEQLLTVGQVIGNAIERRNSGKNLEYRIMFENVIMQISTEFINVSPEDFDSAFDRALTQLGEFAGVDRSYLIVFANDSRQPSHAYEWCNEGIETFLAEALVRPSNDISWAVDRFREGKHLEVTNRDNLAPEAAALKAIMESENTHAMIAVPLILRGQISGYMGFDVCRRGHRWPEDMAQLLRIVGDVFVNAIDRASADAERLRLEKQILHTQKLEGLGVLAGGIAHDFNNLLVGIVGNADLALADLPADSPARENIAQLLDASKRASDLTQQMLAYSGQGAFVLGQVDFNEVVRGTLPLVNASISKKARLRLELAQSLPPIEADSTQIHQIAMNLFINASEALDDRPGDVIVRTGVEVREPSDNGVTNGDAPSEPTEYVYLEVADTGIGMDAKTRERIFDPFYSTKFTGRGLGLAAVAGIVKGHNGFITVKSDLHEGSVFRVYIPRSTTPGEPAIEKASVDAGTERWSLEGAILVVDDEPAVREFVRRALERHGFEVITADGGVQATELFEQHWERISAVVLDMTMPDMGGFEVYQSLQKIDANVQVLLSSGYSEQDATSQFEPQNLAGFIQKPFTTSDLLERLLESIPQLNNGN